MTNIKSRILSLILVLTMVFSLVTFDVFAADVIEPMTVSESEDTSSPVAKVGNTEYATIDQAIAAWTNGTTLTLLADVTLTKTIELSSTEYHVLDLGTYTMTAASKSDAIQIVNNGRSSASYALDIKADADNPGGIIAAGKAVVKTNGKSGVKDRPIIRFYNGVFEASNIVSHSGSNGTNCPQFYFYGGVYNGSINANRALFQFYGGTFNGKFYMSVDSSAYALIAGGRFKYLDNLYGSALNTDKFTIGSAKGVFDKGVHVDAEGYIVVGGPVITELSAKYPAVASNASKAGTYLAYSSAATYGLYYVDPAMAIKKHGEANVTVYEKPAVTIPENVAGDSAVVEEIKNNTALNGYTPENLPAGAELVIELQSVEGKFVYEVAPMANGVKVEPTEAITFRLPVPARVTETYAKVYHDGTLIGIYKINGEGNAKYVEISSADFSEFAVEPTVAVAKIGDAYYETVQAAIEAAKDKDTVVILPGEYGAIDISGKNITIKGSVGENGELLTTVKGGSRSPAITGHSFNGTIADLEITDAWQAMYAEPAGDVTIDNVYVSGCTYAFHLVAYSAGVTWIIQNSYMDLVWANSFGVYGGGNPNIIVKGNEFVSTNPYYPDYGALAINTSMPNLTVEGNVFGENTKIYIDNDVTDTSNINISKNYHADGVENAFADDADGVKVDISSYYADKELTNLVQNRTYVAEVNGAQYETLEAAIEAAKAGDTIVLLSDVLLADALIIAEDKSLALDLNGYKINGDWNGTSTTNHIYVLKNYGTLTIEDSVGKGAIVSRGIYNYGTLTLNSGTIDTCDGNGGYAVYNMSGSTFVMNGGKIIASLEDDHKNSDGGYDSTALNILAGSTATLNGGVIESVTDFTFAITTAGTLNIPADSTIVVSGIHGAIAVSGGVTTVNGGTFQIPYDGENRTDNVTYIYSTGKLIINGGTFIGDSDISSGGSCVADSVGGATITGGSFSGSSGGDVWGTTGTTITGGIFTTDVSEYCADGFTCAKNDDGTYGIVESRTYVAEVNGTKYESLQHAIIAAAPNGTVNILTDITIDKWTMFSEQYNVGDGTLINLVIDGLTINGNNKTITVKGIESAGNGNHLFDDARKLTIKDLTIKNESGKNGGIGLYSGLIENVTFIGGVGVFPQASDKTITITGCTFKTADAIYFETERDNLVVTGNTFDVGDSYAIIIRGGAEFTDNTVVSGKVNVAASADGVISGNKFGDNRFKVYNAATATISNNEINYLVFNDETVTGATFTDNTLSESAEAALEAVTRVNYVAEVNGTKYATLEDAIAAIQAGETLILLEDVTLSEILYLPAGIILNGNGKTIAGEVWAEGNLTFVGYTKVNKFNAGYNKPTITIGAGACLETTDGRMVIGHGATFNISGNITDAKAVNVADLTPSLIAPGASFTGAGVNFNVTNAYIKFTAYCSSKNNSANGMFNFNVKNSVWEQTGSLTFSEPTNGKDPTINFVLTDSVLNTTSHIVFGVSKGNSVFDNSIVNNGVYRQLENRHTLTIKNGSVVYAAFATSSNAKNPGTLIIENATLYATSTSDFSGSDLGTGTLVIKKGANVTIGAITKANIVVDITGMSEGELANFNVGLAKFAGTVSVVGEGDLEANIVDGKIVLSAKAVAEINGKGYATLEAAIEAAKAGDVIVLLGDLVFDSVILIGKSVSIDGNGHKITSSANRVFRITTGNVEVTLKDLDIVSTAFSSYTSDIRGVSIDSGISGVELTLDDCTVSFDPVSGSDWAYAVNVTVGNSHTIIINGGTYEGANVINVWGNNHKLTIDGAILNNLYNAPQNGYYGQCVRFEGTGCEVTIKNTVFTGEHAIAVGEATPGANTVAQENNTDNTKRYRVKNGDTYYYTLEAAIEAATTGDTIVLLASVNMSEIFVIDKAITLDGNGNTLTSTAERAINVSGVSGVVIENLTIKCSGERAINVIKGATDVTIENVTATAANYAVNVASSASGAVVVIRKSNLNGLAVVNIAAANAKIDIIDTVINNNDTTDTENYGAITLVPDAVNAVVNVSGGNINVSDDSYKAVIFAIGATVTGVDDVRSIVAMIGQAGYLTLEAAIEAAKAGDTIVLLAPVIVDAGETLTIDKNVVITYTSNVVGEDMITVRGTLNIEAGRITYINTDTTGNNVTVSTISCEPGSALNISGGIVENKTVYSTGSYAYAIDLLTNGNLGNVTATISGGVVYSDYMAIRQFNNGTACKNSLTITGGEIYGAKRAIQVHLKNDAAYLAISGGKIEAGNGGYALCIFPENATNIAVIGGEFIGTVYSGTEGIITGGTYSEELYSGYIKEGYTISKNDDGSYGIVKANYVVEIDGVGYESLQAAIDAATTGDVIKLLADIALFETVNVAKDKVVTLNLNGFTITGSDNSASDSFNLFINKGVFTITDSVGGKITLQATTNRGYSASSSIISNQGGDLTILAGTLEHLGGSDMAYVVDNNSTLGNTTLVVEGGTLISPYRAIRLFQNGANAGVQNLVTVNGGTIKARAAIWVQQPSAASVSYSKVTVNGGVIDAVANAIVVDLFGSCKTDVVINAGSFKNTSTTANLLLVWPFDDMSGVKSENAVAFDIKGGDFSCAGEGNLIGFLYGADANSSAAITGGTYSEDISEFCADGFTCEKNAGGTYGVVEANYVVEIAGKGYESLEAAIDAATTGDVIKLLGNIALAEGVVVGTDKVVTIDLAGCVISRDTDAVISTAAITNNGVLTIMDSIGGGKITAFAANPDLAEIPYYANNTITNCGVLTIKSGTIENSTTEAARAAFTIDNNSTLRDAILNIEGGTIIGRCVIRQFANSTTNKNEVNMTAGLISGTSYGIWVQNPNSFDPNASLTISGGEVDNKIYLSPSANFDIAVTGGKLNSFIIWAADETNPARNPSGFVTGGTFTTDVSDFCAAGFTCQANENGTYGIVEAIPDGYLKAVDGEGNVIYVKNEWFNTVSSSFLVADPKTGKATFRFTYHFNSDLTIENFWSDSDWAWTYWFADDDTKTVTTYGNTITSTNRTSIRFDNLPKEYFGRDFCVQLHFKVTIGDVEYTVYDKVRTISVYALADMYIDAYEKASDSDKALLEAAYDYALAIKAYKPQ